jgi:fructoselysine 3-epimerase
MKLAYNSNAWRFSNIQVAIQQLSKLNYSAIELSCQPDQLFPIGFSKSEARTVRQLANDTGLAISNLHAGNKYLLGTMDEPSLVSPDEPSRQKRLEANKAAIDLAVELGVNIVAITSGASHRTMSAFDSWHYLVDGLHQCIKYAEESGVTMILEPEPELFIRSITDFLSLTDELGSSSHFGLNLDIGHSHCMYEDIPSIIRECKSLLVHVHLEDIAGRQHKHLIPGEGDIDFAPIFQALSDIGYSGYVSLELQDHCDDPASAAALSRERVLSWMTSEPADFRRARPI